MQLVNLAPGINVRPDKVDLVLAQKQPLVDGGGFFATVFSESTTTVSMTFDTAAEAEQCADDWTRKINGTEVGPIGPKVGLLARAERIVDDAFDQIHEWGTLSDVLGDIKQNELDRTRQVFVATVLGLLGGEA